MRGSVILTIACTLLILKLLILQGCCKFCQKELSALKELSWTLSEVKKLKKQVRILKRTSGSGEVQPEVEKECREIFNFTSVFDTVNLLMRRLSSEEEIIPHSVSGRASNSKPACG